MLREIRRALDRLAEPIPQDVMGARVELLKAHYAAVREEEMERIRQRDQYLKYFATAVAAIGGVFFTAEKWWGLLVSVPFLAAVVGLMYAHTDITLGALSRWLRFTYTEMLKREFPAGMPLEHWDGAGNQAAYVRSPSFWLRYVAVSVLLAAGSAVAIEVAKTASEARRLFGNSFGVAEFVLWTLAALGSLAPLLAWFVRVGQLKNPGG